MLGPGLSRLSFPQALLLLSPSSAAAAAAAPQAFQLPRKTCPSPASPGLVPFPGPAAERRESQNAGSSFGESREGRSCLGCPDEATPKKEKEKKGSWGRGRATLWQPFASVSASRTARDLFSGSQPFLPRGEILQVRLDPWVGVRWGNQAHRSKDAVAQLALALSDPS